jgi:hypothetical protein
MPKAKRCSARAVKRPLIDQAIQPHWFGEIGSDRGWEVKKLYPRPDAPELPRPGQPRLLRAGRHRAVPHRYRIQSRAALGSCPEETLTSARADSHRRAAVRPGQTCQAIRIRACSLLAALLLPHAGPTPCVRLNALGAPGSPCNNRERRESESAAGSHIRVVNQAPVPANSKAASHTSPHRT